LKALYYYSVIQYYLCVFIYIFGHTTAHNVDSWVPAVVLFTCVSVSGVNDPLNSPALPVVYFGLRELLVQILFIQLC
jgi:hypothetical protein